MLFFIHTPYSENTRISKHSYYFWSSSHSRLWILSFSSYGYQQAHTVVYLQTVRRGALRVGGRVDSTNVKATVSIQKASVARYNVTFYLWFESNQQWYQSRCFSFQFLFVLFLVCLFWFLIKERNFWRNTYFSELDVCFLLLWLCNCFSSIILVWIDLRSS